MYPIFDPFPSISEISVSAMARYASLRPVSLTYLAAREQTKAVFAVIYRYAFFYVYKNVKKVFVVGI